MTATITSKGQITIPVEVRKRLNLRAGDRVDFVFEDTGRVALRPKKLPVEHLRGMLRRPGQRPVSVQEMDEGVKRAIRDDWRRIARQGRK